MARVYIYYSDTILNFGTKHKGETINEIIKNDPQYLLWCVENIDWFILDDELLKYLLEDRFATISIVLDFQREFDSYPNVTPSISFEELVNQFEELIEKKKERIRKKFEIRYRPSKHNELKEDYQDFKNGLDNNWLADAAGTDDPETLNDVFWNLD